MQVALTKENVKITGRTHYQDKVLWMALSGCGISFTYTGKKLELTLLQGGVARMGLADGNYARFAIFVDGECVINDLLTEAEKSYLAFESRETKQVTVELIKLSESAMSVLGVRDFEIAEGESVTPLPAKVRKLEVIGDSITCGYGVEDEDPLHGFKTATENVMKSYSYKIARDLDADYSMFSASGYGIISGYTPDPEVKSPEQLIPLYYHSLGFSYDCFGENQNPTKMDWDFSNYQPDAIVINLGTNDDSYCQDTVEKQEEYRLAYIRFLQDVRTKNPDAVIFASLGIMGTRLYPVICKAVEEYQAKTGDFKVYTILLPEQDASIGYVADYHPLECAHDKAGEVLVREMKRIMNW